jgi:hypothetical protein
MSVAEKITQWAVANGIGELQAATLDARSRLNDASIGTQVKAGRFRVVSTIYSKKTTTVTPLSDWLVLSNTVAFLKMLKLPPKPTGVPKKWNDGDE